MVKGTSDRADHHHDVSPHSAWAGHTSHNLSTAHGDGYPNGAKRLKAGRPRIRPPVKVARCLIRLFVKTGEKLKDIFKAAQDAEGFDPQYMRTWFEGLTDTSGPEKDNLCSVRVSGRDRIEHRDRKQDEACEIYRRTREERKTDPDVQGPIAPGTRGVLDHADPSLPVQASSLVAQDLVLPEASKPSHACPLTDGSERNPHFGRHHEPILSEANDFAHGHTSAVKYHVKPTVGIPVTHNGKREREQVPRESENSEIGKLLRCLSSISPKKAKRNSFLVRQCTVTEEACPSRVGTGQWIPRNDEQAEYTRLYHDFSLDCEGLNSTTATVTTVSAIILVKQRNAKLLTDEQFESCLEKTVSAKTQAQEAAYVNEQDVNGVTALHLAVAFGLSATCAQLLRHGADHTITTADGARPHDFAQAAERCAGQQWKLKLYMQIMICREFVRRGQEPRVPGLGLIKKKAKRKRRASPSPSQSTTGKRKLTSRMADPRPIAMQPRGYVDEKASIGVGEPSPLLVEKDLGKSSWIQRNEVVDFNPSAPEVPAGLDTSRFTNPVALPPSTDQRSSWYSHDNTQPMINSGLSPINMSDGVHVFAHQRPYAANTTYNNDVAYAMQNFTASPQYPTVPWSGSLQRPPSYESLYFEGTVDFLAPKDTHSEPSTSDIFWRVPQSEWMSAIPYGQQPTMSTTWPAPLACPDSSLAASWSCSNNYYDPELQAEGINLSQEPTPPPGYMYTAIQMDPHVRDAFNPPSAISTQSCPQAQIQQAQYTQGDSPGSWQSWSQPEQSYRSADLPLGPMLLQSYNDQPPLSTAATYTNFNANGQY